MDTNKKLLRFIRYLGLTTIFFLLYMVGGLIMGSILLESDQVKIVGLITGLILTGLSTTIITKIANKMEDYNHKSPLIISNKLKNITDIPPRGKLISIKYLDNHGILTERQVKNFITRDEYLDGFCLLRKEHRTFRLDRIESFELEDRNISSTQSHQIVPNDFKNNKIKKDLRILFTGFAKQRKAELETIAKINGFRVMKTPTPKKLDFIVMGKNAGPTKIENAKNVGATFLNEEQFLMLLKTGELPSAA